MSLGSPVNRVEDPPLLRGSGTFVADVQLDHQCEAHVLRSPHAHARINEVDTGPALESDGVVDVFTAEDLPNTLSPIPMRLGPHRELEPALQFPLARDRVRYAGEPVALVLAEDRYRAEDASEAIRVDYDPLPVLSDLDRARSADSPLLHDGTDSNDLLILRSKNGNVDEALEGSPHVLEDEFSIQRHSGIPLETRGLVADPGSGDRLEVYGPTKVVHFNRDVLSKMLNLDPSRIRFMEPHVGGGFGIRGEFYPEDFLIPYAARNVGRPVRWVEDRLEHFVSANHSREQRHRIRIGFNEVGRIRALKSDIFVDMGAYIRTHGSTVPQLTQALLPGPYVIPAYEINTHVVLTNKTGSGTYRSPGRFECNFVRERMLDQMARHLDQDPLRIRERNLISPEQMPFTHGIRAMGERIEYDSGDYPKLLQNARKAVNWEATRKRNRRGRQDGRLRGIGSGFFVEKTGAGPWEFADVELTSGGQLICRSGLADVGQGVETMLAQVCSERLGISIDRVRVIHGDTDEVEKGRGTYADRGTVVGGCAAWKACTALRETMLEQGAETTGEASEDLNLRDGALFLEAEGRSRRLMSFDELLDRCHQEGQSLREKHTFHVDHMTYPYGLHIAEIEIDPETGRIDLVRYHLSYDVGRAVNPKLVRGQLIGGIAQGLGGTLFEELCYNEEAQLVSGSFMDYLIPGFTEMPRTWDIRIYEDAPSPLNPLGVKGAGEGGTAAVAPAVANAVQDALRDYPVNLTNLPIRPETIRRVISGGSLDDSGEQVPS